MAEAKLDWMKQPEVKAIKNFKLPRIDELQLNNGIPLTVIHEEREGAFRLDIVFECGQVDQSKLLQATTTCRMLKEGTHRHTSHELAEKLDYYGAWLETATYFLYTRITLYSLTKYADETIRLLAELVREASFPEHEFTIINTSNKAYSQVVSSKSNVKAQRALLTGLFGKEHICGQFATAEDYDRLSVNDLRDYYQQFYGALNCHVFFAGKLTESLRLKLESAFGETQWGEVKNPPIHKEPLKQTSKERRFFTECPTANQYSVRMGCFLMPRLDDDFLYANFFNTLFGGFFGSRLMTELREKRGLTYGISSTISMYPFDTLLLISSETSGKHIDELIAGVYQEIHRLQNELVGDDELTLVKNYFISDLCRAYEEPFSVADYCINMKMFNLPYNIQENVASLVTTISPDNIRDFARKWLSPDAFIESVSGKRA